MQVVDSVTLGMGGAVIDADGIFVPPSKMTLVELRVELEEAGTDTTDLKRPALTKAVKVRLRRIIVTEKGGCFRLSALAAATDSREWAGELAASEVAARCVFWGEEEGDLDVSALTKRPAFDQHSCRPSRCDGFKFVS